MVLKTLHSASIARKNPRVDMRLLKSYERAVRTLLTDEKMSRYSLQSPLEERQLHLVNVGYVSSCGEVDSTIEDD
jgi:hypothetical protein